jgi:CheY-like chemotaxis protein
MAPRILIVEDNATNLELVQYLLNSANYATLSAADGEEGLRVARQECPDLVICDLQMPVMNGYEVINEFKADIDLQKIPIVAVTASSMSGDSNRALAAGFDGYIPKPIEPETFVQQVEKFLPPDLRASRTDGV